MVTNREKIENILNQLIIKIGDIQIGTKKQFPYGWRKAKKGRTVWRILEEVITQNLEYHFEELGFDVVEAASSEVGVYDFKIKVKEFNEYSYINIKSSVKDGKPNSDDISKAKKLKEFYIENPNANLYIATFEIVFNDDMSITLDSAALIPTHWVKNVYVNPSNGNLQSPKTKSFSECVERTHSEFLTLLTEQISSKLGS